MNIPILGKITPYPFQWEVVQNTLEHIRKQLKGEIKPTPAYMNCYVSAGKTIIAGAIARHCQKVGAKLLILARTGELVEQDSDEVWNMGGKCSIYSASLDRKSTYFSTVVGTEGTVANALDSDFSKWVPHVILIDECFVGGTMISTKKGKFRIDDKNLVNQYIACIDTLSGKKYYHKPLRVFSNGVKSISRVKTNTGEFECTDTHKIFTTDSWVEVKNLKIGQKIVSEDLQSCALRRLLRASVAVAKELFLELVKVVCKYREDMKGSLRG